MSNAITKQDMALRERIFPFTSPEALPLSFRLGEREFHGIPLSSKSAVGFAYEKAAPLP
ncbi:MAG: hypothetical protein LBS36_08380 [Oscillospiraceae bacterium]|jgi:hypothetical protein|nr:hypothetical protein [Oscillospiraceae bacterium]